MEEMIVNRKGEIKRPKGPIYVVPLFIFKFCVWFICIYIDLIFLMENEMNYRIEQN